MGHLALALTAPQFRTTWGPLEEELGAPGENWNREKRGKKRGITWNIQGENQFFLASNMMFVEIDISILGGEMILFGGKVTEAT